MANEQIEQSIPQLLEDASNALNAGVSGDEAADIFRDILERVLDAGDAPDVALLAEVFNRALSQIPLSDRRHAYFASIVAFVEGRFTNYLERTGEFMEIVARTEGPEWLDWFRGYGYFLRILRDLPSQEARGKSVNTRILHGLRDLSREYFPQSAMSRFCSFLTADGFPIYRVEVLNHVLQKDPGWAMAWIMKGDILMENRDWTDAMSAYANALADPRAHSASLYWNCARAKEHLNDPEGAVSLYEKCLAADPAYPQAEARLGRVFSRLKQYDAAEAHLRRALETDADRTVAARALLQVLEKSGRSSEALAVAQKYPDVFASRDYRSRLKPGPAKAETNVDRLARRLETAGTITIQSGGSIDVSPELSRIHLYPHQHEALDAMARWTHRHAPAPGFIVIPSGGDRTFTAIYWLARDVLNEGAKVIWLVKNPGMRSVIVANFKRVSHKDVMPDRSELRYQILADAPGQTLEPDDDLIVATRAGIENNMEAVQEWLRGLDVPVCVVLGEAHLLPRKAYRDVVRSLREASTDYRLIGLSSYPFSAAETEKGVAGRVFPEDVIYSVDTAALSDSGVMASPFFSTVETGIRMEKLFREAGLSDLYRQLSENDDLDLDSPEAAAASELVGSNEIRNSLIADTYAANRGLFGQTVIFAATPKMAVELDGLLKKRGIRSEYVLSAERDNAGQYARTPRENAKILENFRSGKLDVLVNVNLFAGDVNIPQTQTIFLTKPSKSPAETSSLTERILRGPETGGTSRAYIVTFMDMWSGDSMWIHPERLFIDTNSAFHRGEGENEQAIVRLISLIKASIAKRLTQADYDAADPEKNKFLDQLPVGLYQFDFYAGDVDQVMGRSVLVHEGMEDAFTQFFEWMQAADLSDLDAVTREAWDRFFSNQKTAAGSAVKKTHLRDIIAYYREAESLPDWIPFRNRKEYDIAPLARHIVDNHLDEAQTRGYLEDMWHGSDSKWIDLFGFHSFDLFADQVRREADRIGKEKDGD